MGAGSGGDRRIAAPAPAGQEWSKHNRYPLPYFITQATKPSDISIENVA